MPHVRNDVSETDEENWRNSIGMDDDTDHIPKHCHITFLQIVAPIISIISHTVDVALDANLAYSYYAHGEYSYFKLTLLFILFPALVNTVISTRMYVGDEDNMTITNIATRRWLLRIFVLVFQIAPILRHCDVLIYALKARKAERDKDVINQRKYYELMVKEDSDAALLRLFECFLEAAPQQVLQITIMLTRTRSVSTFIFSRILSISVASAKFPTETTVTCGIHWLIMTAWLSLWERTTFCSSQKLSVAKQQAAEILFCSVLGLVYIFTYVTPKDGRNRTRYAIYYTVCLAENVLAVSTWATADSAEQEKWFFYPLLVGCIMPFVVGIGFMILYYLCFHPRLQRARCCGKVGDRSERRKMELEPNKSTVAEENCLTRDGGSGPRNESSDSVSEHSAGVCSEETGANRRSREQSLVTNGDSDVRNPPESNTDTHQSNSELQSTA